MAAPPRVTRDQVDAVIEAIAERHRGIGDPHLDRLTDDPAQVLAWLRRYSGRHIPDQVRGLDILDGLVLRHWLWWERQRDDHWLLTQAEALRLPRSAVRRAFGAHSNQAVRDATGRVRALFDRGIGRRDEKAWRAARRRAAQRDAAAPARAAWFVEHAVELRGLVDELLAYREQVGDAAYEAMLELQRDQRAGDWSAVTLDSLGDAALAVAQLPGAPAAAVRGRVGELRSEYEAHSTVRAT